MAAQGVAQSVPRTFLPADFDRGRWLDPLTFQGLIGAAIAHGVYERLFRPDGFSKSIDELVQDRRIAKLLAEQSNNQ